MPVEQRGRPPTSGWSQRETGGTPCLDGRRQPSLGGTSRMNREVHVRICGGLGVKVPGSTRQGSEAQGRHREVGSEVSVEQRYGPMYKNRIRGLRRRTSWQMTTRISRP